MSCREPLHNDHMYSLNIAKRNRINKYIMRNIIIIFITIIIIFCEIIILDLS